MPKRLLLPLALLLLLGVLLAWQTPTILRALPSRYVARLPQPLQALGARQTGELLPTAASTQSGAELLAQTFATATNTMRPSPQTPTPPPTATDPASNEATRAATAATATPDSTATAPATAIPLPVSVELAGVQHRIQTWNNCGPATLSMALSYFGEQHSQERIAETIKPDPEDRNVTPEEMAAYVKENSSLMALSRTNGDLVTLRRLLSEQIPVIIEYGLQPENEYRWLEWMGHYLLVTAYDDEEEAVWVYDSWPRTGELPDENFVFVPLKISYADLDRNWQAFNRNYIALYPPQNTALVQEIVGSDMEDDTMWQNSLEVVRRELSADAENPFLWFNLGTALNARGDFEQAAAAFDQARAIGLPWRMLWYQFGPYEAYYQIGRYEDVILLADVTLKDRPYFEESYYYMALAQLELGQVDEARRNLRKAVDFNPNFQPARAALEELELAGN